MLNFMNLKYEKNLRKYLTLEFKKEINYWKKCEVNWTKNDENGSKNKSNSQKKA